MQRLKRRDRFFVCARVVQIQRRLIVDLVDRRPAGVDLRGAVLVAVQDFKGGDCLFICACAVKVERGGIAALQDLRLAVFIAVQRLERGDRLLVFAGAVQVHGGVVVAVREDHLGDQKRCGDDQNDRDRGKNTDLFAFCARFRFFLHVGTLSDTGHSS